MFCLSIPQTVRECPRGVMVKPKNRGFVVSDFELQSPYYLHFRTNTLGKVMNPLSYGLDSTTTVLLEEWLWHYITHEGWYAITQRNQTTQKVIICTILFTFLRKKIFWSM